RVERVAFEVGTVLEKGAVLAELDDRRLQLELEHAKSVEAAAESLLAERRAVLEQGRADLRSLESATEHRSGVVSEQALRQARTDVALAEARLASAELELAQASNRIALLEVRLADMVVRSPFAGRVVARNVDPGEWLGTGDPVATIVSTGVIEAWIEVDERFDFGVLDRIDSVRVRVETLGAELQADRVRVVGDVDPRSRRFVLIADLTTGEHPLAPGMSVTAFVPTGAEVERILVPTDALVRDTGGYLVYVLQPGPAGHVAVPVGVRVLHVADPKTTVLEHTPALRSGNLVVVEGN